jgi:hypothetical protein
MRTTSDKFAVIGAVPSGQPGRPRARRERCIVGSANCRIATVITRAIGVGVHWQDAQQVMLEHLEKGKLFDEARELVESSAAGSGAALGFRRRTRGCHVALATCANFEAGGARLGGPVQRLQVTKPPLVQRSPRTVRLHIR